MELHPDHACTCNACTDKIECERCEEFVVRDETENGVCNWCLEQEHERQERTY